MARAPRDARKITLGQSFLEALASVRQQWQDEAGGQGSIASWLGACAQINKPSNTIQPVVWGFRNPSVFVFRLKIIRSRAT